MNYIRWLFEQDWTFWIRQAPIFHGLVLVLIFMALAGIGYSIILLRSILEGVQYNKVLLRGILAVLKRRR